MLFLPSVAPIFPFQTEVPMKWFTSPCCWNVKVHWCCMVGAAKSKGCWNAKSTDVTTAKYEDKSLYFIFKFILLNIFYSLSFYRWMQAILISFHYLMNMIALILHQWTCILINRSITVAHILFGHEPPLDTYFLEMNYHWTYIIWT